MAQIRQFPFVRHLRAEASSHIQQFRKGVRVRSGKGLSFWFLPIGTSLSEIPMDDRVLPFLLRGQSSDYQDVTVQGSIVWRVEDPERLGDRLDFSIDLATGARTGQPIDQVNDQIGALARRFLAAHVKGRGIREILEAGVAPLQDALAAGFADDGTLGGMGLGLVGVGVDDVAPTSELARALSAPVFESLQQQADEATFARRALAVEKERAIAENELGTKIELETRKTQLIAREDENTRAKAAASAAVKKIGAEAEAERIRIIDQARADMERARLGAYAGVSPTVLMALAAQEFASKLERIDNLTVTPDMLAGLLGQLRTVTAGAGEPS